MSRLHVFAATLCFGLAACQPAPVTDPSTIPPPANLAPGMPPSSPGPAAAGRAPGFDGAYSGTMFLTRDAGGACTPRVPVTGMTVSGNVVRFGQFPHTPIGGNGGVQMVEGRIWLTGNFDGRQFVGNVTQGYPGCEYRMVLNRS